MAGARCYNRAQPNRSDAATPVRSRSVSAPLPTPGRVPTPAAFRTRRGRPTARTILDSPASAAPVTGRAPPMKTLHPQYPGTPLQGYATVPATSDAKEYLRLLLRHKFGLLVTFLLGLGLAWLYLTSTDPVYETRALVEVNDAVNLIDSGENRPVRLQRPDDQGAGELHQVAPRARTGHRALRPAHRRRAEPRAGPRRPDRTLPRPRRVGVRSRHRPPPRLGAGGHRRRRPRHAAPVAGHAADADVARGRRLVARPRRARARRARIGRRDAVDRAGRGRADDDRDRRARRAGGGRVHARRALARGGDQLAQLEACRPRPPTASRASSPSSSAARTRR